MYYNHITSRKDPRTGKRKQNPVSVLFIISAVIVPVVSFLFNYVYINANSFLMGFQYETEGEITWGFKNFTMLYEEIFISGGELLLCLRNTTLSFLMRLFLFGTGFLVSFFLYKKIFLYKFFRTCFFLPSIIAGTVVSSVFLKIVSVEGPVAALVMELDGLEKIPDLVHNSLYANKVVFFDMFVFGFASNMILWGGTFGRIPESCIEAAKLDGVRWWQEVIYIIIPLVWPTFALQFLLTFCGFFGASGNVFLLTRGEYGTNTLHNWMYLQVLDKHSDSNALNYMAALGLILTFVSVSVTMFLRKKTVKMFADVQF